MGAHTIKGRAQSLGANYACIWQVVLRLNVRQAGIRSLNVQPSCTVSAFGQLFPDQRRWILRLAGYRRSLPVVTLFATLRYTGPPEYFSMFTCIWGSDNLRRELQKLGPDWLDVHRPGLVKEPLRSETVQTLLQCVSKISAHTLMHCCVLAWPRLVRTMRNVRDKCHIPWSSSPRPNARCPRTVDYSLR